MGNAGSPFSGKEGDGGNSVKAIRPKPWPGLARPQDSYLGEPLPSAWCSGHCWVTAGGTFNSHFRVLKKAPSASGAHGGRHGRGAHCLALSTGAWCPPGARDALSGETGGHTGLLMAPSPWLHTLLKLEGLRALAITRTMCCAGGRQILFVFVSGLGELGKPGKAGFSLRGYTTEEKKPHCWPKLTSFFSQE